MNDLTYPGQLAITPLGRPAKAAIQVPGSKSITNRALILAACSDPNDETILHGALECEDTQVMVNALKALGIAVVEDWAQCRLRIRRPYGDRLIPANQADLFIANSGTSMRFLTAFVSIGQGSYRLDGLPRMRERPIGDLIDALSQLGIQTSSKGGYPPVTIHTVGLPGGNVRVRGDTSSQFLSALLLAAPFALAPINIELTGSLVSEPYVRMTLAMLRQFGARIEASEHTFRVNTEPKPYPAQAYYIEPDASAASYFLAAAAITQGEVTINGLTQDSLQGDVAFVNILERMGATVRWHSAGCTLTGSRLHGVDVDMNSISDCVMTLAAAACFAEGPTVVRNVSHIRHKETDRLGALATELGKAGIRTTLTSDGIVIQPGPLRPTVFATYNDHRMAMSLALLGLRAEGIVIDQPACVAKTYPRFFEDLARL